MRPLIKGLIGWTSNLALALAEDYAHTEYYLCQMPPHTQSTAVTITFWGKGRTL